MPHSLIRNGTLAALDIGTTKVSCFIARPRMDGSARIIGAGHLRSQGLKNGVVVDMDAAETTIRSAVEVAEQMADERIESVIVSLSGAALRSTIAQSKTTLSPSGVTDSDIRRVIDKGLAGYVSEEREILHCIPVSYILDGEDVRDPRHMFGRSLGVRLNLISANAGQVRNLETVVERCHLDIAAKVAAPYAAGLSALVEDEKTLGVTVVEMGAGTTGLAIFMDGTVVHVASLPVGGDHITQDLARGLTISLAQAERVKTLDGCTFLSPRDRQETLSLTPLGEESEHQTIKLPKADLVGIIRPRVEETLELVRHYLERSGFSALASRRVVLTGGACQLQGIRETAGLVLDRPVRLGRPSGVDGLPSGDSDPTFTTAAGLIHYGIQSHIGVPPRKQGGTKNPFQQVSRLGQWFLQNF